MKIFEVMQSPSRRKRILCVSTVCLLVVFGAFVYYLNMPKATIIARNEAVVEMAKAVRVTVNGLTGR